MDDFEISGGWGGSRYRQPQKRPQRDPQGTQGAQNKTQGASRPSNPQGTQGAQNKTQGASRPSNPQGTQGARFEGAGVHPGAGLGALILVLSGVVFSPSLTALAGVWVLLFCLFVPARVSLIYPVKLMAKLIPLIVLVLVIQLLLVPRPGQEIWVRPVGFFTISITLEGLAAGGVVWFRVWCVVLLLALFTATTSDRELTYGVEALLRPLTRSGLPAHELALVIIIAFRFVPILRRETSRILRAQAARGADISGRGGGLVTRVRQFVPLLIPVFLLALRRAEIMALALEARYYRGGKGRTRLRAYRIKTADIMLVALSLGLWVPLVIMPLCCGRMV